MVSNQQTQQSPAAVYLVMSKKTGSTLLARIYREQAAKLFNTHTHTHTRGDSNDDDYDV